jgi:peroxiredoxin
VTLSPQLPEFSRAWVDEDGIEFPVLSDLGLGVARDFGLTFQLPDYLKKLYAENLGIDLVRFNGDESWELPISATFVIDRGGTTVFAWADPDYTVRAEPADIVAAIPTTSSRP